MKQAGLIAGLAGGALCVAAALCVPVDAAPARGVRHVATERSQRVVAGAFTPAAADPRLAAVFARGGLAGGDFHFTPADTRGAGRAVMVAVRVRSNRTGPDRVTGTTPAPGLAPIAYNAGVVVGWKRFALAGDLARIDLGPQPGSRQAADLSVSYQAKRFIGRVKAVSDRPIGEVAHLVDQPQSYSVDIGGAYKLTRNLDVTAGVRYRSDRDRLNRIEDDRRDSQAAYVGTIFRF